MSPWQWLCWDSCSNWQKCPDYLLCFQPTQGNFLDFFAYWSPGLDPGTDIQSHKSEPFTQADQAPFGEDVTRRRAPSTSCLSCFFWSSARSKEPVSPSVALCYLRTCFHARGKTEHTLSTCSNAKWESLESDALPHLHLQLYFVHLQIYFLILAYWHFLQELPNKWIKATLHSQYGWALFAKQMILQ